MTTLQVILLAIIIIVLHVQAGMVWELYFRQEEARHKRNAEQVSKEQQNSQKIVNANTRTFGISAGMLKKFAICDDEQVSKEDNNEQDR